MWKVGGNVKQTIDVFLTGSDVMGETIAVTTVMKMRQTVPLVIPQETGSVPTSVVFPSAGSVTLTVTVMTRVMKTQNFVVSMVIRCLNLSRYNSDAYHNYR